MDNSHGEHKCVTVLQLHGMVGLPLKFPESCKLKCWRGLRRRTCSRTQSIAHQIYGAYIGHHFFQWKDSLSEIYPVPHALCLRSYIVSLKELVAHATCIRCIQTIRSSSLPKGVYKEQILIVFIY